MNATHTYSTILFEISEDPKEAQAQIEKVSEAFGHKTAPDLVSIERAGLINILCARIQIVGEELTRPEVVNIGTRIDYYDGLGLVNDNKVPSSGNLHALMLQPM